MLIECLKTQKVITLTNHNRCDNPMHRKTCASMSQWNLFFASDWLRKWCKINAHKITFNNQIKTRSHFHLWLLWSLGSNKFDRKANYIKSMENIIKKMIHLLTLLTNNVKKGYNLYTKFRHKQYRFVVKRL